MQGSIDLAVIGGSGFYDMPGLATIEEVTVDTPFGATSDAIRIGTLAGKRIAFLARHGRHHNLLPGEIPQRANFWALKTIGVTRVVAVSAVGSLVDRYRPGEFVAPDQFIDRTRANRPSTFFGAGVVAHVAFAEPTCAPLRRAVVSAATHAGATVHEGGAYVCIEGPAFGTRAESELYRSWHGALVGMTAIPEAKLAREAELCYAVLAAITDYDAWRGEHEAVDAATVFAVLQRNVAVSQETIRALVASLPTNGCDCGRALDSGLITPPKAINEETRQLLAPILRRRLEAGT